MGLDMYLKRTILVPGWKPEDYEYADECVAGEVLKKPEGPPIVIINAAEGTAKQYDPTLGTLEKARLLAPLEVREAVQVRGEGNFQWFSIFEEVGYWRKVNAVHRWFVENAQGGVDECQLAEVTKEQLSDLREACARAFTGPDKALPARGGFFFGSTEYDEWYRMGLFDTIEIINRVLRETDWKKQIVFYGSSW